MKIDSKYKERGDRELTVRERRTRGRKEGKKGDKNDGRR